MINLYITKYGNVQNQQKDKYKTFNNNKNNENNIKIDICIRQNNKLIWQSALSKINLLLDFVR